MSISVVSTVTCMDEAGADEGVIVSDLPDLTGVSLSDLPNLDPEIVRVATERLLRDDPEGRRPCSPWACGW